MLPQRSQMEKHKPSRLITRPASPSRYIPDAFQIVAAEHVPKSSYKMRNRRPFRYTAGSISLTVQPPSLPRLSRSAHLVAAVQKGPASTIAKLLIAGVENHALACLTILYFGNMPAAESMFVCDEITLDYPPIFPAASTCSWKWSTIISALSQIAWSWLSTYRRSFLFAFFVSNSGSSSVFLTSL